MDSFDYLVQSKYKNHSPTDQKALANAMKVWFGYEKPLPPPTITDKLKNLWWSIRQFFY